MNTDLDVVVRRTGCHKRRAISALAWAQGDVKLACTLIDNDTDNLGQMKSEMATYHRKRVRLDHKMSLALDPPERCKYYRKLQILHQNISELECEMEKEI